MRHKVFHTPLKEEEEEVSVWLPIQTVSARRKGRLDLSEAYVPSAFVAFSFHFCNKRTPIDAARYCTDEFLLRMPLS